MKSISQLNPRLAPVLRRDEAQGSELQGQKSKRELDTRLLRRYARSLQAPADYRSLLEHIGPARFVLLGEASHGSHQFYAERAKISLQLIEQGFDAVLIEGDWPDAARVHRYLQGQSEDHDAIEALSDFKRFPTWMWRNADVLDFVGALYELARHRPIGFYGLDLYSLHRSMQAVLSYLDQHHPEVANRTRKWYACFDLFDEDPQRYGLTVSMGLGSCEQAVLKALLEMHHLPNEPAVFDAEQNARIAKAAEAYYRAMFSGRPNSWNLRDTHMADTLDALDQHLSAQLGRPARLVVWAHNSHIGDARATGMQARGELNLGQLMRQRHGEAVCLLGFSSWAGTVTAASDWDAPAERKELRQALPSSWEDLLHGVGERFWINCHQPELTDLLQQERLERFVGVIYRPDTERWSHYLDARLGEQFDLLIHLDQTRALEPLERQAAWEQGELPETYPSAL